MLDERELLRTNAHLRALLEHYAQGAELDREAWKDRVMARDGLDAGALVRLHGVLIAHGWLEQNTGVIPALRSGSVLGCYRVTTVGHRVLKWLKANDLDRAA